ncbi:unnamed protein product [marine sediment metagenome]|uniref:Uncharacterized protein n=1 Tax=marine sediment metagenome TaxID=412755 RepID=X1Q6Z8_9ZZZZ
MYVHGSHGFRGGGGPTRAFTGSPVMGMVIQGTGTPPQRIHSTLTRDTDKQTKGGQKYVVA